LKRTSYEAPDYAFFYSLLTHPPS